MSELKELEQVVASVGDTMTADDVLEVRERLIFAKAAIRELEKGLDQALIEWINANGDLVISEDKRLYIGRDKRIRCNDPPATLEALFEATGGDFIATTNCLSANPFKYGACKRPLGDGWEKHFTETIVDTVKVKTADKRFAKSNRKEIDHA